MGRATETLLDLLSAGKPKAVSGIPTDLKSTLERLIVAPGEGSDHAICIIARELRWLDYVDPAWTRATILPWFDPENPAAEPAWNGFLYNSRLPKPELFSLLKPHFLNLFAHASKWNGGEHTFRRLHEFLVIGCFQHGKKPAYISYDEVRRALQQTDDKGRAHSINCIEPRPPPWGPDEVEAIRQAIPEKGMAHRNSVPDALNVAAACGTGAKGRRLLSRGGRSYSTVSCTVFAQQPVCSWLTRQSDEGDEALATRFPDAALALIDKLVPDGPDQLPYNLGSAVEMIAERSRAYAKTADGVA